jgi:hypothetical protein
MPNRGGNYESTTNAGPAAMNLNNTRGNSNNNRGAGLDYLRSQSASPTGGASVHRR